MFPVLHCITLYSRYSRYSRYSPVFPVIPVFPVFPVIPVFPGIPGYPGIPVYSPVFPGIPVYSRSCAPREATEPRGPFLRGAWWHVPVGQTGHRVVGCGGVPPGTVPHPPMGGGVLDQGYTTPPHHAVTGLHHGYMTPRAAQERASGLRWPRGVRVARGRSREAAPLFLYLRSFWPGIQSQRSWLWGNRWIGSRSRRPWGLLDVSDLECLRLRCGRAGSGDGRSRIRRLRPPDPSPSSTDPAFL